MADSEALGIERLEALHYFVDDPARSDRFYASTFGWRATWATTPEMTQLTHQHCTVYEAGQIRVAVSHPVGEGGRAWRYLRRHPAGIGSLAFAVTDVERTWNALATRRGTFIHPIRTTATDDGGRFRHFSITTALGDVTFRFFDRTDTETFAPGFQRIAERPDNPLGFTTVDHVTSNAQTLASVALWFEHVLGFERYWDIEFHTEDVRRGGPTGTGLRSTVYWDPRSGIKFPINEPLTPFFKEGQINRFIEDNWGAGIQHVALGVEDIQAAVEVLGTRGVRFLDTPPAYYEATPTRLAGLGVDVAELRHDIAALADRGILIDGSPTDRYLLQIFLKDAMTLHDDPRAGPFFYELIERCGDPGFGGGNFRALFEAIEREQQGVPR